MKKFKIFLLLTVIFVLIIPSVGCAATAGPWRGQVIDAETKAPIEGAVVVAVWYRSHFGGPGGPVERFEDARETMTDKDGKWEIPAYEYNAVFRDKTRPEFTIFKPGYGSFPHYQVSPREVAGYEIFIKEGAVVELPKLKSEKERRDIMLYGLGRSLVGKDKAPNFYRLYNEESKKLGFGEL